MADTGKTTGDGSGSIESRKDFDQTPSGQYKFWLAEINSAFKRLKRWHKAGDRVVNRFLDKTGADRVGGSDETRSERSRPAFSLNLFHSNVTTLDSLLYGNLPEVDVSRKFSDAADDVARVAAETMERLLNTDITDNAQEYDAVLRGALQDRLLPGLGCGRVRYEVQTREVENPEGGEPIEEIESESAPIDYYNWRDVLWGWGRNFSELPWIAYRSYLTKDEVETRFGKDAAEGVVLKAQTKSPNKDDQKDPESDSAWQKAEVWEIWDKNKKKVCWLSVGYDKIMDTKDDPLKLCDFFPSPPFFIANATTSLYIPTPDFHLAQDLYNEIDILQTRISIITEAVKVVGVYDKSAEGVERMFAEGVDNKLIPVDNWAMFAEKGGIQGQVDWFPIADVVAALDKLRSLRDETIQLLQQVTGMSDIMQGGLQNQYEGVGQSKIKAKFGSVRIQKLQDDFATFASGLCQLKAEVIARHFEPSTIVAQSNMEQSVDKDKLPDAVRLIKDPDKARLKIIIRPETVAMTDFAEMQEQRTGFLNGISTFLQSAGPLMEAEKATAPFLLQLLQWGLAGFKGAQEIEGVVDKAIEATIQAQKDEQAQPKPDPEQAKAQAATQLEDKKSENRIKEIQAKSQAEIQARQNDLQADVQTTMATHNAKLKEIQANMQANIAEVQAKMTADAYIEQVQAASNIQQTEAGVDGEIKKDIVEGQIDREKETEKHRNKMTEIMAAGTTKIAENRVKTADEITKMTIQGEKEDGGKGDSPKIQE